MKDVWLYWEKQWPTRPSSPGWFCALCLDSVIQQRLMEVLHNSTWHIYFYLDFYDWKSNVCFLWKPKQKKANAVLFNQQVFLEFVRQASTPARFPGEHAKSLQSCPSLCNAVDCSPPGSSVHGVLQARTLERVAMPSPRASSPPRDRICISYVSCIGRWLPYP